MLHSVRVEIETSECKLVIMADGVAVDIHSKDPAAAHEVADLACAAPELLTAARRVLAVFGDRSCNMEQTTALLALSEACSKADLGV